MRSPTLQRRIYARVVVAIGLAALLYAFLSVPLSDTTVAQSERPPSLVLIEEAFQRGELDYETALLYKVYSLFAPDRLPSQFQSDTPSRSATMVLVEVQRNWGLLSPQTQALLSEFIPPPSLSDQAVQGPLAQTRPALEEERTFTTTHFVIHYTVTTTDAVYEPETDVDPANGVPDYVDWVAEDAETVWQAQIQTMGWLEPPPDQGDGGDDRYDIYLKNLSGYYGYTNPNDGFVGDNPNSLDVKETNAYYSYIALENDFNAVQGDKRDLIRVTLAHEFNHAIQMGYDGLEASWLMEATATWMEDEVYDDINDNYQFLSEWFDYPDIALDTDLLAYHYGRWIFARYISEHHGGQATVRRIWEHAVTADSLDAVNAALAEVGTDFDTVFPRFAAANYVLSSLPPNDPYTYEEADGYRNEVGGVEIEAYFPFTGTPVAYDSFFDGNAHLEEHSAEYWVISATESFSMTFAGNPGIDYAVQGALRRGDRVTVKLVPLTSRQGTLVVYDPAAYDQVVIIVANVGATAETSGYTLTFQSTTETPPAAALTANPLSGTTVTMFTFDASGSTDAQTPSGDLEVRWDWEGNGVWDTEWSLTKTATHTFSQLGTYTVTVEVRDGVDLRDTATRTVQVVNTPPVAAFSVLPTVGITDTVFQFDGSASSDAETPAAALEVRWDWEDDGVWDTPYSSTKLLTHTYAFSNTYVVRMEVRDGHGATDTVTHSVSVRDVGHPPTASFTFSPSMGITTTVFTFDASGSQDDVTPSAQLEVRWDWEGDGGWDTPWSTGKVATHTFPVPGVYTVTLLVRDGDGLEGWVAQPVQISASRIYLPLVLRGING